MDKQTRDLLLFDIDGTLTVPRQKAPPELKPLLLEAKQYFDIAIVGGSDRVKHIE